MRRALLPLLMVLAVGAPAPALGYGVAVEVSGVVTNPYDPAFDNALDTGMVSLLQVTGGVRLWEGLSVELGYLHGAHEGSFSGGPSTSLLVRGGLFGVRYAHPLASWVDVFGRVDALVHWGTLELSSGAGTLRDTAMAPGVATAAGVELHLPTALFWGDDPESAGRDFTFGVLLDIGYAWFGDLELDALQLVGDLGGAGAGSRASVGNLGALSLSSMIVRVGAVVHF